MLTTIQKVKETLLLTLLNVVLPTVDMSTDMGTIIKLFIGSLSHVECDETSELEPYASSLPLTVFTWNNAQMDCVANNSYEGRFFNSHPTWAILPLVCFLINYLTTWVIWWNIDKSKCTSWVAPLLSVYPQVNINF